MFYYINGLLTLLRPDCAVLDCGGVGYLLNISAATFGKLSRTHTISAEGNADGGKAKLYTHFSVKEDGQELYGFFDEEERDIFRLLIGVSGIGPKGALSVLSTLSPSELAAACAADDARAIARANGVGLKTAQKVILELKDKLQKTAFSSEDEPLSETISERDSAESDALEALLVLGYTKNEAVRAVKAAGAGSTEERIRKALSLLMKQ